mgnify:CR=1 FL=1
MRIKYLNSKIEISLFLIKNTKNLVNEYKQLFKEAFKDISNKGVCSHTNMMIEYYKNGLLGIEKYHGVISIVEEFFHNLIIKGDFRLSEISDSIE